MERRGWHELTRSEKAQVLEEIMRPTSFFKVEPFDSIDASGSISKQQLLADLKEIDTWLREEA